MDWFLKVVKDNYANFTGRARRKEFWMFQLVSFTISAGFSYLTYTSSMYETASLVFDAGLLVPSLAVGVRRMHDIGKSGWNILIPFYNIYLYSIKGDRGENQYGLDPIDEEAIFLFGKHEENEEEPFDLLG